MHHDEIMFGEDGKPFHQKSSFNDEDDDLLDLDEDDSEDNPTNNSNDE